MMKNSLYRSFSGKNTTSFCDNFAEVVIGFEHLMYLANESAREVVIAVLVRDGQLGRAVTLDLTTMDGTALSKRTRLWIATELH